MRTVHQNLEILRSFIMASSNLNIFLFRDEWRRWKSRSKSKRRYFSIVVAIRIGWKMVVWFYGMLLPSAKCPRPPGRRENYVWKTIWRTMQRTSTSFWSIGWSSSDFNARFIKTSSIWQESSTSYLSWLWADPGENLEMRYSGIRFGRSGKSWTHQKFISSENQRERGIDNTKKEMNSYSQ